ncbi:MAG: hypothetical protein ABIW82_18855 [Dokdonella sp.]
MRTKIDAWSAALGVVVAINHGREYQEAAIRGRTFNKIRRQ